MSVTTNSLSPPQKLSCSSSWSSWSYFRCHTQKYTYILLCPWLPFFISGVIKMSSSCWIFSFMFNHSCFLSMCSFIHDAHDESSSIHQPRFSIQTIVTVVVSWPCNVAFVDPVANHLPRSHPGPVVSSHDLCEAVIPHTEIDWSQQLHSSALLSITNTGTVADSQLC